MRSSNLQQFVTLRRQLNEERAQLESRLQQLNEALAEMAPASASPSQGAAQTTAGPARRGRKPAGGRSLRDHVIAVLEQESKSKEEILDAVRRAGYNFSTKNPLNSLGVILYGKNPKLNRADGKFSLGSALAAVGGRQRGGRRQMSAAGRERIAAAQRARWAKQKRGTAASSKAPSNGKTGPKRTMNPAARKAIAEAARKRWAAAKAAGMKRL